MNHKLDQIIKIAEDVYKTLGSGHPESIYDKAMQVGLRLSKIKYENQKVIELKYKDHNVGEAYPDLVVWLSKNRTILELKAVSGEMGPSEEQQLKNYMKILKVKYGLLINFQQPGKKDGKPRLEIKKVSL